VSARVDHGGFRVGAPDVEHRGHPARRGQSASRSVEVVRHRVET
jgi:hypothetical protein